MENIPIFFETYLDKLLFALIILSGIFVTKYVKTDKISNVYKVLITSILMSVIVYFVESCNTDCFPKYLFTYFFATSFYELITKFVVGKINKFLNDKK